MSEYQVFARKYRPQCFSEIVGQDAMVITLKNAIRSKRLAQAYLFSGSRGTGKTTTARILAKALNCRNLRDDFEPCNACSSCKEISDGYSLDVLEIDGASHRGIEDIRQINETVGYASASGMYKIYIIDEVHMLTKEAFNALLKTLEEPPPKVKFFFATTEPQKVPATILSRCQRFSFNRIRNDLIVKKLQEIIHDVNVSVEEEALHMIAHLADGGLRDAESLLDQVLSFHEGEVNAKTLAEMLGVTPREVYFELDQAGREGDLAKAFDIAHRIFSQGKNILSFVEGLVEHIRNLLGIMLLGKDTETLCLSDQERERYLASVQMYRKEQCIELLDFLLEAEQQIRFAPSMRIALEAILLRVIRSHRRIPVEILVKKLAELQEKVGSSSLPQMEEPRPITVMPNLPASETKHEDEQTDCSDSPGVCEKDELKKNQSRYDTLLQFTAVELEGTVQKKR